MTRQQAELAAARAAMRTEKPHFVIRVTSDYYPTEYHVMSQSEYHADETISEHDAMSCHYSEGPAEVWA